MVTLAAVVFDGSGPDYGNSADRALPGDFAWPPRRSMKFYICSQYRKGRHGVGYGILWVRRPVSRVLSRRPEPTGMTIHLGRPSPDASRDRPGRRRRRPACRSLKVLGPRGRPAAPIWSCSRWGLPCRFRCRSRGALLPHHFTLACRRRRAVCFLWHFPWGCPRRALPGTVSSVEPGLSSRMLNALGRSSGRLTRA